jgi:predicted  nucleic acid-binding Zn-ribbon protein
MLPALDALIALQDLDTRAEAARRRLADAPVKVAALDATLAGATQALEKAKAALAESQTARRELEREASAAEQKVSKYKDQLMQAKDNKQFHALQHEIATFSGEQQRVEELEIGRMLEIDERAAVVKAAEAALAKEKSRVAAEKATIDADASAASAELATLIAARGDLTKTIDARLLTTYETVAKQRKGTGISRVVDGLCEACRVRLRPHLYNQLRVGDQIIQCESCVRILYWIAPPTATDPPAEPTPAS